MAIFFGFGEVVVEDVTVDLVPDFGRKLVEIEFLVVFAALGFGCLHCRRSRRVVWSPQEG